MREYRKKDVLKRISLISTEDETIPELVEKYVKEAEAALSC